MRWLRQGWLMGLAMGLAMGLTFLSSCVAPPDTAQRPNVLLILVDDLNDWVGWLGGHPQAKTPNMDRLAASGVRFTNAHCQAPICNPSRVSMMTGVLPSTSGVYLLQPARFRVSPALRSVKTMPEHFSACGYRSYGAGKIFHASTSRETFDEYGPRASFGPRPKRKLNYPQGSPLWDWGIFPRDDRRMPDAQVADYAIEKLGGKHAQPFFLAVGFARPHVPLYVPKEWFAAVPSLEEIRLPRVLAEDRSDISDYAKKLTHSGIAPRHAWFEQRPEQWRRAVRAYLACIRFVDHQVGRVLAALDASEHAENTIVVLASDHGFHLGEKQRWAKRSLWRESTRVPMILRGPGIPAGLDVDRAVGLIDVYPTLVACCGVPRPAHELEGVDRLRALAAPAWMRTRPVVTTFCRGSHALVTKDYRYIRYADGSEELYDRLADPHEWRNLTVRPNAEVQGVLAKMRRHLPKVDADYVPGSKGSGSLIEGLKRP